MFKKILIANRGEIACRIIKTARHMGITTVAVYSDVDRSALHVSLADEALRIGPAPSSESYLSIEAIVDACRKSGAEAVHPGYGFLSERADFCRALMAAGVAFIGPNPAAMEMMGDKIAAKALARSAGVAIVPGSDGAVGNPGDAAEIAQSIGYPVMIKASAGGGGKGLRIASSAKEVEEGFARAASEAKSAFGDDRVFIEKFIQGPRHIEIQILGDKHGTVIHLGERECSIQRRHQKVIEEAPSPFVDAALREAMGAQAVALARAVGYDSAGTVEFIVGADRRFYFLEMNTRLQVEHAVTECVTGLDLVEQMFRCAAGEALSITQSDVAIKGHAIESRIYAENPERGFLPSTGRLTRFRPPFETRDETSCLRLNAGVYEGGEVSIHYDPMLAKLITYAPSRDAAIEAQAEALDCFVIDGVAQNISFLNAIMDHPRWKAGDLSTSFIAEEYPQGFSALAPKGEIELAFVCAAACIDHVIETRAWDRSRQNAELPASVGSAALSVFLNGKRFDIELASSGDEISIRSEDRPVPLRCRFVWKPGDPLWHGEIDGRRFVPHIGSHKPTYTLSHRGFQAEARVLPRHVAELAALLPQKTAVRHVRLIKSPLPGLLKAIYVSEGQRVTEGEALCMIEAMKMEHILRAETGGLVQTIHAKADMLLGVDAVIMEFE